MFSQRANCELSTQNPATGDSVQSFIFWNFLAGMDNHCSFWTEVLHILSFHSGFQSMILFRQISFRLIVDYPPYWCIRESFLQMRNLQGSFRHFLNFWDWRLRHRCIEQTQKNCWSNKISFHWMKQVEWGFFSVSTVSFLRFATGICTKSRASRINLWVQTSLVFIEPVWNYYICS